MFEVVSYTKGKTQKEIVVSNPIEDDAVMALWVARHYDDPASLFGWHVRRWDTGNATITLYTD